MAAPRADADASRVEANGTSPRRNTAGAESINGERSDAGSGSGSRPRGASSGAQGANAISTTPKKGGGLLGGLRNPMVALRASSDGEGSSNRDGSSEGGASPSDDNETRTRLLAKIEGAKQRLLCINLEREHDMDEFIAMADKVEAAGGRDTPHMARIKQHYDRKTKKSTGQIDVVQKKLAGYEARLADLDGGGSGAAPDPLRGHTVLQGIRRTGANLKQMTSTVVSAPLELAQKLKRGTMGSSSDPMEGDLGQSQFYSSQASRSASGLSSGRPQQLPSSSASNGGPAAKPKASTLPASMRINSPVDLGAAAAAAVAAATVPSSSSGATTSSVEWPKRHSRRTGVEYGEESNEGIEDCSLARLPSLGVALKQAQRRGGADTGSRGDAGSPDTVPFVMVPRHSMTGGNSEVTEQQIAAMFDEMRQLRQHNVTIVKHMDKLQEKVQQELAKQKELLTEERFKYQRLEDSLNEFIDLHQHETRILKENLEMIGSRLNYQYNDRFKKVEENLESTQNHMFRVENSLRSSLEMKEAGPWFHALLLSGATILVELLKIALYLTAVVLDFFRPFTGTRTKAGFFLLVLFLSVIVLQNAGWIVGLFNGNDAAAAAASAAGQTPPLPAVQPPPQS